jgi:hypothetical protein
VFALHTTEPVAAKRVRPFVLLSPYSVPIVAVNVTLCPYTLGFSLEVTTTVVVPAFTFCTRLAVLAL